MRSSHRFLSLVRSGRLRSAEGQWTTVGRPSVPTVGCASASKCSYSTSADSDSAQQTSSEGGAPSDSSQASYVDSKRIQSATEESALMPRWRKTPEALVAPVSTNRRRGGGRSATAGSAGWDKKMESYGTRGAATGAAAGAAAMAKAGPELYKIPDDPFKVERVYHKFLGQYAEQARLSEETRWLALTHKTFDQGRRGFNDRLSFLGKRIVNLQTSLSLLTLTAPRNSSPSTPVADPDQYGRVPFLHPALEGVEVVTAPRRLAVLDKINLARLGRQYGLNSVVRWTPADPSNLALSGEATVVAQAVYAIIGAIALEKGGDLAARVAKERVVEQLGL